MRHFHDQLQVLRQKTVVMGSLAESMIGRAIECLVKRNEGLAAEVFEKEKQVNALQMELDDLAVTLTCLQQPVARDARLLFMASRIGGELERIADQAVNICQNVHYVLAEPLLKSDMPAAGVVDLPIMAETAQRMLRDSLTAMINQDAALALAVRRNDDKVDAFRDQIFRSLLTYMMADPRTIQRALSLILIARNLERIGDHATNISEEVIYWVEGRDVRHGRWKVVLGSEDTPVSRGPDGQHEGQALA